jgi:cytochrome b subunit of formate dehydrogenase
MQALHWSLAAAYFGLLATGFALVFGPALAAAWDGYREPGRVWASDRLNLGQRVNVVLVTSVLLGLAITGLLVSLDRFVLPQTLREVAYEAHRLLAYATIPLVAGHLVMVVWAYTGH